MSERIAHDAPRDPRRNGRVGGGLRKRRVRRPRRIEDGGASSRRAARAESNSELSVSRLREWSPVNEGRSPGAGRLLGPIRARHLRHFAGRSPRPPVGRARVRAPQSAGRYTLAAFIRGVSR